jgi:hypothetical protein
LPIADGGNNFKKYIKSHPPIAPILSLNQSIHSAVRGGKKYFWHSSTRPPNTMGKIIHKSIKAFRRVIILLFLRESKINSTVKQKYNRKCINLSSFRNVGTPLKVEGGANDKYNIQAIRAIVFQ